MKDLIEFGKIVNTHGLKGEVKVYSYTDNNSKILKLKKVYINDIEYKVQSIKLFKNMFILKLEGIDIIEDTKVLINNMVYRKVDKDESNETDGYFIRDLIGLEVYDENSNLIGTLKEVFVTGANDVYEVLTQNNESIYLPAIKDVVKKVDIDNKKIIVKIMEGLI